MYLKEIKAFGFKSFADKISIEFGKNINGIVGPNGSGKSNIVDAVRWVLGEQSIKSLRGDTATDIIFSGSKNRKPLNSASVTLVFDNSDRHLPIDYSEIAIKRVLFRTGENEYYLNNERCRLKDITDLLTDSGAAKESFNIISQGKIDEILSTKPTDRRVIFEEAAGVLKYKKRKEEAIRKLDRTNTNINRINDIIIELSKSIEPLREQSEKALLYNEYKEKLSNIEIALITSDIENLNYEYQESKKNLEYLTDEILELSKNNTNYDTEILKYKNKLKDIEDDIYDKQNILITYTKSLEQLDADIRLLEERNKYKDDIKVNSNIDNVKIELMKLNNIIKDYQNIIQINTTKIEHTSLKLKEITDNYNKEIEKKKNIQNKVGKNNRDITDIKYKISYLEEEINTNSSLPSAVKNILNNPKFTGIHNVVGALINTDSEYSLCISTALMASSSNLVVDNKFIAKELVLYLKDNNIGRATFYPIDTIKGRYIDTDTYNKIKDIEGFIDIACNLVKYDEIYHDIVYRELGNVIITDTIETANKLGSIIGNRYRIISLDGQVVNVGGSITGGSKIKSRNTITLKYELDTLNKKLNSLINDNKNLDISLKEIDNNISKYDKLIREHNLQIIEMDNINKIKLADSNMSISKKNQLENELKDLNLINDNSIDEEKNTMLEKFYSIKDSISNIEKEINILKISKEDISNSIIEIEDVSKKSLSAINKKEKEKNNLDIKINRIDVKLDNLLLLLTNDYNLTFDYAKTKYKLEINTEQARKIVLDYKDKLRDIGIVNLGSIEEFERVNERYTFLEKQKEDLTNAEDTLLEIIDEMDSIMKDKFLETFNLVKLEFKTIFRELFKGGTADVYLTDPDNILETGIEIFAEPPGKKLQSISLLSGGEKTFTAISLLFAILNVRPVPFCLLDEVEAALDEANVNSFGNYLSKYRDKTQFILITHKKKTMEFADILYGITMKEAGISKLVSVKLEELANK